MSADDWTPSTPGKPLQGTRFGAGDVVSFESVLLRLRKKFREQDGRRHLELVRGEPGEP